MDCLVSVEWLAARLEENDRSVRVVDCSWYMPAWKRDNKAEYAEAHIPGAVFYDQIECSDKTHPKGLGHMCPSGPQFSQYVGKLGISNSDHVILYDADDKFGMFASPRCWWVFKAHGHKKVSILDGGLQRWKALGHQVTKEVPKPTACSYTSTFNKDAHVKVYDQVLDNLSSRDFVLIDARPAGRFNGTAPEPNPKIKPGHIPDAVNLAFPSLYKDSKVLKEKVELEKIFAEKNIDLKKANVITCGSGFTACHVALAAYVSTGQLLPLYDGAWTEWFLTAPDEHKVDMPKE